MNLDVSRRAIITWKNGKKAINGWRCHLIKKQHSIWFINALNNRSTVPQKIVDLKLKILAYLVLKKPLNGVERLLMVRQMTLFPIKLVEIIMISLFSCLCQTKLLFFHLSRNLQKCKFNMVYHRVLSDLRRINSQCNGFPARVKPLHSFRYWLWGPLRCYWLLCSLLYHILPYFPENMGKLWQRLVFFVFCLVAPFQGLSDDICAKKTFFADRIVANGQKSQRKRWLASSSRHGKSWRSVFFWTQNNTFISPNTIKALIFSCYKRSMPYFILIQRLIKTHHVVQN